MYAGKIFLTGTEKGVGVNMQGDTAASAGSILLTASGDIINTATLQAAHSVTLTSVSGSVQNRGSISATDSLDISAGQGVDNQGGMRGNAVHLT